LQAVVLAAGEGKRLRKYFPRFIKPLVPINGRPLVTYTLDKIITAGIGEVYLVIKPEYERVFRQILKNYPVKYLYQKKAEGTARAVLSGERVIKRDFLLSYCDLITNFNYRRLLEFHDKFKPLATLVVKKDDRRDNEVVVKGYRVIKIVEKPKKSFSEYTAIGVMCLSPKIFKYLKKVNPGIDREYHLPVAINMAIREKEAVYALKTSAFRINLNTKEDIDNITDSANKFHHPCD